MKLSRIGTCQVGTSGVQFQTIFSTRVACRSKHHLSRMASPVQNTMLNMTKKSGLTSAILRYKSGEERFQFSFKYHERVFNFSRPISETIESFAERARANLAKKIRQFDTSSTILCQTKNNEAQNVLVEKFENILQNNFEYKELIFQIGEDSINVNVNPPEVFKIKFLKKSMIGYSTLPVVLEGSDSFDPTNSSFEWSYANSDDLERAKKRIRKKSECEKVENVWVPCEVGTRMTGSHSKEFPIFTPDESFAGKVLRLTCIPSNASKSQTGYPFSTETEVVVHPPESNLLFHERLSRMNKLPEDSNIFRVVTYNTLADNCATEEWFKKSPPDSLPMDYRLPVLCSEIKAYQADIVCMQEVDKKYFESYFTPFMSQECGLEGILCCKTGEKTNREGVAMFFNRKKFNLVNSHEVIIKDHMKSLPFFQNISTAIQERLEERPTVLHVCVLESKHSPGTQFVIANTHLYFHPDADHIRLLQTLTCVNFVESKLDELRTKYPANKITLLFCGDFNCTPEFGSIRYLTTGKVFSNDGDWSQHEYEKVIPGIEMEHNLQLSNSHPGHELTNIVHNFEGCLDYILYQGKYVELLKTYPPPSKATIATLCDYDDETKLALPNLHAASDHLPVIADFVLRT